MKPEGVHENFACDPVQFNTLGINIKKFIAYIYICFNQNLGENSYISPKIEEVKHLHAVFC